MKKQPSLIITTIIIIIGLLLSNYVYIGDDVNRDISETTTSGIPSVNDHQSKINDNKIENNNSSRTGINDETDTNITESTEQIMIPSSKNIENTIAPSQIRTDMTSSTMQYSFQSEVADTNADGCSDQILLIVNFTMELSSVSEISLNGTVYHSYDAIYYDRAFQIDESFFATGKVNRSIIIQYHAPFLGNYIIDTSVNWNGTKNGQIYDNSFVNLCPVSTSELSNSDYSYDMIEYTPEDWDKDGFNDTIRLSQSILYNTTLEKELQIKFSVYKKSGLSIPYNYDIVDEIFVTRQINGVGIFLISKYWNAKYDGSYQINATIYLDDILQEEIMFHPMDDAHKLSFPEFLITGSMSSSKASWDSDPSNDLTFVFINFSYNTFRTSIVSISIEVLWMNTTSSSYQSIQTIEDFYVVQGLGTTHQNWGYLAQYSGDYLIRSTIQLSNDLRIQMETTAPGLINHNFSDMGRISVFPVDLNDLDQNGKADAFKLNNHYLFNQANYDTFQIVYDVYYRAEGSTSQTQFKSHKDIFNSSKTLASSSVLFYAANISGYYQIVRTILFDGVVNSTYSFNEIFLETYHEDSIVYYHDENTLVLDRDFDLKGDFVHYSRPISTYFKNEVKIDYKIEIIRFSTSGELHEKTISGYTYTQGLSLFQFSIVGDWFSQYSGDYEFRISIFVNNQFYDTYSVYFNSLDVYELKDEIDRSTIVYSDTWDNDNGKEILTVLNTVVYNFTTTTTLDIEYQISYISVTEGISPIDHYSDKHIITGFGQIVSKLIYTIPKDGMYSINIKLKINGAVPSGSTIGSYPSFILVDQYMMKTNENNLPSLTSPEDISLVKGTTTTPLKWMFDDKYPGDYELYQNNELIKSNYWGDSNAVEVDLQNLDVGVYNFTIVIYDGNDNRVTDAVNVEVIDTIHHPVISLSPGEERYLIGVTSSTFSWIVYDDNPDTYNVTLDGILLEEGNWYNGTAIVVEITSLSIGEHVLVISFYDYDNLSVNQTISIVVIANPSPTIIEKPSDVTLTIGSEGNYLTWIVTDDNPLKYNFTIDGSIIDEDTWQSNDTVSVNIDNLSIGNHVLVITFYDYSGNLVTDTVNITVIDEENSNPKLFAFTFIESMTFLGILLIGKKIYSRKHIKY